MTRSAFARVRAGRCEPGPCARDGRVSLEGPGRNASSRSTRSSARRATDAAGVRAAVGKAAQAAASDADRHYGNARIAFHAARQLNPLAARMVSARPGMRRCPRRSAHGACARRCVPARGRTCWRRSTRCRRPSRQDPRGATGRRARCRRRAAAPTRRRSYAALAARSSFYGMLSAEALGQRQSSSRARRSSPMPQALAAFGATPGIRRAVKLAQLDMRPESQREWLYVVRGRPTTRRCCSPRTMRAARDSTIARSTRPSGPRRATISACAT